MCQPHTAWLQQRPSADISRSQHFQELPRTAPIQWLSKVKVTRLGRFGPRLVNFDILTGKMGPGFVRSVPQSDFFLFLEESIAHKYLESQIQCYLLTSTKLIIITSFIWSPPENPLEWQEEVSAQTTKKNQTKERVINKTDMD